MAFNFCPHPPLDSFFMAVGVAFASLAVMGLVAIALVVTTDWWEEDKEYKSKPDKDK